MTTAIGNRLAATGNTATAEAMRQIAPDVVAAYPISPQTEVIETFSQFVSDGLVTTEFVPMESEHSAMSACVGAAAAGARVMTATSSQGLAFMWEVLYIASGMRLPIVMANVNRTLSAPVNIHCDHTDSMGCRDTGWIQLYCTDAQEAYDSVIQAVRIAEHPEVRLPVMVCYDGYIISHGMARMDRLSDDQVRSFVGEPRATYPLLDVHHPVTYGPLAMSDYYFEHKRQVFEAAEKAAGVIKEVGTEYGGLTGRHYGLVERYQMEDAEIALVVLSSAASTAKAAVRQMRERGVRAGLVRIRSFRPFPRAEILESLRGLKAVCVLDRSGSPGTPGGPVGTEVRATLFDLDRRPKLLNGIFGIGGRDTTVAHIVSVFEELAALAEGHSSPAPFFYLGLREG